MQASVAWEGAVALVVFPLRTTRMALDGALERAGVAMRGRAGICPWFGGVGGLGPSERVNWVV